MHAVDKKGYIQIQRDNLITALTNKLDNVTIAKVRRICELHADISIEPDENYNIIKTKFDQVNNIIESIKSDNK